MDELCIEEEDFSRLIVGLGGRLWIWSSLVEGTLSFTILFLAGGPSVLGVASTGKGRLGGLMAPPALLVKLRRTCGGAGRGGGGAVPSETFGGFTLIAGFLGAFRTLSDCLNTKRPYTNQRK